ncbi:hypothetical protein BH10PSE2_BH10PSE2_16360 [soil metagenome]
MPDEQDQSEVFDEDNYDDADPGAPTNEFRTFEELPQVLDVTSADGDADEEAFDEDDQDLDDDLGASGIEAEADALLGADGFPLNQIDAESNGQRGEDEVELVYSGLMEDERGAQSSAAHWEAKRLSDDDIADLGYGPEAEQPESVK